MSFSHLLKDNITDFLNWRWLLVYLLFVFFFFFQKKTSKSFLAFLFPKDVFRSASFFDDLKIFVFYIFTTGFLFLRIEGWHQWPDWLVPAPLDPASAEPLLLPQIIVVLILALCLDFGNFLSHWLLHQTDFLWQFHKVHHSAQKLNLLTQYRSHPVEPLLRELCVTTVYILTSAPLLFAHLINAESLSISSLWLANIVFYLTVHLRHSHFYFSFGPYLSHIFSSPAMHQIHHSIEARHKNKNFAIVFSFWDHLFGSFYLPKTQESFRIGLADTKEQDVHRGFCRLMLYPLKQCAILIWGWLRRNNISG